MRSNGLPYTCEMILFACNMACTPKINHVIHATTYYIMMDWKKSCSLDMSHIIAIYVNAHIPLFIGLGHMKFATTML